MNEEKLTGTQEKILVFLKKNSKGATSKEICVFVKRACRTTRGSLRRLMSRGLVKRIPNLSDMRCWIYYPVLLQ